MYAHRCVVCVQTFIYLCKPRYIQSYKLKFAYLLFLFNTNPNKTYSKTYQTHHCPQDATNGRNCVPPCGRRIGNIE